MGPILPHDNDRPHNAESMLQKVNKLGCEILPHLPYSPDLVWKFFSNPHTDHDTIVNITFKDVMRDFWPQQDGKDLFLLRRRPPSPTSGSTPTNSRNITRGNQSGTRKGAERTAQHQHILRPYYFLIKERIQYLPPPTW